MAAGYISRQRNRLIGDAKSIPLTLQEPLRGFFSDALLGNAWLVQAVVSEPTLYPVARFLRIGGLLEMSMIGAITLVDVVAYPEEIDLSTLFHELVHVVQYRVLGLKRFAKLYVSGFLRSGSYEHIPLEVQAYELGARFDQEPGGLFDVQEDVIRRRDCGLF
jgi:hypothetical protein